ncbi:ABC transporter permease [Leptolyngbya ohadii]|uniref:ABC transporter permease n=1 Tax=Leptolyngbya ohadii TaxID=1962290 RepID=UPI000B599E9A|nr:ABC transporter permease [Leptolyngbya ohadii]
MSTSLPTKSVSVKQGAIDWETLSFRVLIALGAAIAMLFLTLPTIVVLVASFSSGETLKFPPPGFSLRWYASLINFPEIHEAAWNSFLLASLTTLVCVTLGVAVSLPLTRSRSRWIQAVDALVMSPLVLPGLAVGLALLLFFNLIGWQLSLTTLMISHVVICAPYVVRTTAASLSQIGGSLSEASTSLGANPFYTFWHVTFPLAQRGIIAGAFITFLTSFDNLTVSLFLSDARTAVLPIRMWSMIENNLDVRTAAISGVLIIITAILMILMERFAGLSQFVMKK